MLKKGEIKKEMDDLFRKSSFPLLGFLTGLALFLSGFIIVIYAFPEEIWFLGLALLIVGLVLVIVGARYFIGIDFKYSGGWVPPKIGIPNNEVRGFVKRNEEKKKNIDSLKESIKKTKKYKRKG